MSAIVRSGKPAWAKAWKLWSFTYSDFQGSGNTRYIDVTARYSTPAAPSTYTQADVPAGSDFTFVLFRNINTDWPANTFIGLGSPVTPLLTVPLVRQSTGVYRATFTYPGTGQYAFFAHLADSLNEQNMRFW